MNDERTRTARYRDQLERLSDTRIYMPSGVAMLDRWNDQFAVFRGDDVEMCQTLLEAVGKLLA